MHRHAPLVWGAFAAAMFHVLGSRATRGGPPVHLAPWTYALLLAGPLALLLRRRAPVTVVALTAATTIGYALTAAPRWTFTVSFAIALFTAVKAGRRTPAVIVAAGAYAVWLLLTLVLADPLGIPGPARPDLRTAVLAAVGCGLVVVMGGAAKVRGEFAAEMAKTRAEQARSRAEQERRQASEERLRIARELHDVLGHHLSLISVQAGVGLHLMDSRPEQAREALTAIRSASAEALREVRSVLGVLRPDEEAAPRQPAPGLDRLTNLTAAAGLAVRTTVVGEPRTVPAEVDRAAYRIVQEALTNVRRHAGAGASAHVTVAYGAGILRVTVDDDGVSPKVTPADEGSADGSGITGMRARAETLGGTLTAAPRQGGGFRVEAALPTEGTA